MVVVESREIDSNNTGKAEKIANIEFKTMFKTARNSFKNCLNRLKFAKNANKSFKKCELHVIFK